MDTNNNGNIIQHNDDRSKEKTSQNNSMSVKIKKALLAIAIVAISTGAYAQVNEPGNNNSQDIKNANTLDQRNNQTDVYTHPDGYIMKNGKVMMIQNGQLTQLDNDVTLSNGTTVGKDGSYLLQGGTRTMFNEGDHMDLQGKILPMDKTKNYHKSQIDNPSRKDTTNCNDSIKNKPVEKISPLK